MNVLSRDQQIQIVACLTEGQSIRATERITGIHRDTIMRLGERVGRGCAELHDRIGLSENGLLQPLPTLVIDARHLLAIGLHRLFKRADTVNVSNGGPGFDAIDILLCHAIDVFLGRTIMIDRIRGP